jgi:hypothetical protein
MKKVLVAGNSSFGLAEGIKNVMSEYDITFLSRSSGYDLTRAEDQQRFAEAALGYDVVIFCSALWKFNQTVLLETAYKKAKAAGAKPHYVAIGSTTDRVMKATDWLYNAEKKALRDYCNSLGLNGVWNSGPRVSYISFGSLENVQAKHPDRKTLTIQDAANYIKWLIEQPAYLHVNEVSIDPLQT